MTSKRLHFKTTVDGIQGVRDLMARFMPRGQYALNRTEWQGREPRSCAVTRLSGGSDSGDSGPVSANIEVTYRPKGYISYTGNTRYDGWTAMVLAEPGKPLRDGEKPVFVPREVYQDIDFNELDFGQFVEEVDVQDVKRTTVDAVMEEIVESGKVSGSSYSTFMALHRSRPNTKIAVVNEPTAEFVDRFGIRVVPISLSIENFEQALMEQVTQLIRDFMEGKASIKNIYGGDVTFVALSDVVVDVTPNEMGEPSWFNVLNMYTPIGFLESLAKQLAAVYEVQVEIIEGREGGIVLRREVNAV